jgi:hypothetical protein
MVSVISMAVRPGFLRNTLMMSSASAIANDGTGNFDQDQGAMMRGCNNCTVGPGFLCRITGSTAPTMLPRMASFGAAKAEPPVHANFPAALL